MMSVDISSPPRVDVIPRFKAISINPKKRNEWIFDRIRKSIGLKHGEKEQIK